jgi:N-acetylglucosamine malate deacetylase 1
MKILAIGAHPDDIEIFMYGFLAVCKKRGDQIYMAVATDGAAGIVEKNINLKNLRAKEAIQGLNLLGKPDFLNLPDGKISFNVNAKDIIDSYINKVNPDLILTHSSEDYHPDHRALSLYVSQSAGFKCPIVFSDTLMGVNFMPDIYVDISDFFEDKKKAISFHKSQRPKKFISAITIWNRFRAAQCNGPETSYAEAFKIDKKFPFADIRSMLPREPKYRPFYSQHSDGLI